MPVSPLSRSQALLAEFNEQLQEAGHEFEAGHPTHPAMVLANDVVERLQADPRTTNRVLSPRDLNGALKSFNTDALVYRAKETAAYIGDLNVDMNKIKIYGAIRRLAYNEKGHKVSAKEFEKRLFNIYGTVFTGHPTFSMHPELSKALAEQVLNVAQGGEANEALLEYKSEHTFQKPTLDDESDQSIAAIQNLHQAIQVVEDLAIEVGREEYPGEWTSILYMPCTVGTWVKFDDDGRADITWNKKLEKRFKLQRLMLEWHQKDIEAVKKHLPNADLAAGMIAEVKKTLTLIKPHEDFCRDYKREDDSGLQKAAAFSRRLVDDTKDRIIHPSALVAPLETLLKDQSLDVRVQHQIVKLISRLSNHGITLAHAHYRINSKSVLSALRQHMTVEHDLEGESMDNALLGGLQTLVAGASPKQSNLQSVIKSSETIVTHMTLIRQIIDHIDSHSPVRYLIAETHAAAIPMAALYFAKECGVDRHIDISPLFEDRAGMKEARRVGGILYKTPAFREHYSAPRPHELRPMRIAAFETGYSDSGRYDNQIAAGAWLEREEGSLIKIQSKAALPNTAFCIFNTHGQWMGRGQHPAGIAGNMAYIAPPRLLDKARREGVHIVKEESIQGGDGYMLHAKREFSLAYLAQALDHLTADHSESRNDMYYTAGTDADSGKGKALAFFERLRNTHGEFSADADYAELIAMFAPFMPATGSRPVKRSKLSGGERALPRAIVHNGILIQLGYAANLIYGLSHAIKADRQGFENLIQKSDMFKLRMDMAREAVEDYSPYILREYVRTYSPNFWQDRARKMKPGSLQQATCHEVSESMRRLNVYDRLSRVLERLIPDYEYVKTALKPFPASHRMRAQFNTQVAHGVRLATMQDVFMKVHEIPDIAARHDTTREAMIDALLGFDGEALTTLRSIFKATPSATEVNPPDFGKRSELNGINADYRDLHHDVFDPIEADLMRLKDVTHTLMHAALAVG